MSITFEHVSKHYSEQITALQDVNLHIERGMFGLLGPNGAGKTTLLRIMATVLLPSTGNVIFDEYHLTKSEERNQARRWIGYLPQEVGLYPNLTGEEFLDYFGLLKGVTNRTERHTQVAFLLDVLNLARVARQRIKTYSGGMKRRLGIGQAMMGNPRVIIVDEPTAGLDPEERIRMRQTLTELARDRTVVLSTHIVEDISQTCEQIAILDKGQVLFQGLTSEVIALAQGYTWELSGSDKQTFPETLHVMARISRAEDVLYRLIGEPNEQLQNQGHTVTPTLEDGYIRLKQIHLNNHPIVDNA